MQPDRFMQMCGTGERVDDLVIDAHCHVDHWIGMVSYRKDIEGLIEVADALGIDQLCINYASCPEMRVGNDRVAECMRAYPGRVVGICYVNYHEGGREVQQAELKRCFDELGFKGAKVINVNETYPGSWDWLGDEPDPLAGTWELLQERGASVLCHGILTPAIAERYPGASFIFAHASGAPGAMLRMAELPNVYCDMSATGMVAGTLELLSARIGAERILYGSDMPASDAGQRMGMVMASKLTEDEKRMVLGANMRRLLDGFH